MTPQFLILIGVLLLIARELMMIRDAVRRVEGDLADQAVTSVSGMVLCIGGFLWWLIEAMQR